MTIAATVYSMYGFIDQLEYFSLVLHDIYKADRADYSYKDIDDDKIL